MEEEEYVHLYFLAMYFSRAESDVDVEFIFESIYTSSFCPFLSIAQTRRQEKGADFSERCRCMYVQDGKIVLNIPYPLHHHHDDGVFSLLILVIVVAVIVIVIIAIVVVVIVFVFVSTLPSASSS